MKEKYVRPEAEKIAFQLNAPIMDILSGTTSIEPGPGEQPDPFSKSAFQK